MTRTTILSALAGALLLGVASAALAANGEFDNMCTEGLALGKDIKPIAPSTRRSMARPIASAMRRPRRCS
jgi:hypothetical protein